VSFVLHIFGILRVLSEQGEGATLETEMVWSLLGMGY